MKCVFWFSVRLLSVIFFVIKKFSEILSYIYLRWLLKCPSDFTEIWVVSTDIRIILKYQISWKSIQWEPSYSMRTDRRKDRHGEANSRSSHFYEGANKYVTIFCGNLLSELSCCTLLSDKLYHHQDKLFAGVILYRTLFH